MSDLVIVVAKTDPTAGAKQISLFLVEAGLAGFTKGQNLEKLGMKAQDTAELFFQDVRVAADNLLGEEGRGFVYLMQDLPRERLSVAISGIGTCKALIERTVAYTQQRKAFGSNLAAFQNTQFKLAELQCRTADECLQLHGGWGYMWEYQVCRAFADARVQRIYAGSNEITKLIIARGLFK